jgi:hypothetical protein
MAVSASCLVAVIHVTDRLDHYRRPSGIAGDDPLKGPPSTLVVTQPTEQIAQAG